jgi:hypothetical protein
VQQNTYRALGFASVPSGASRPLRNPRGSLWRGSSCGPKYGQCPGRQARSIGLTATAVTSIAAAMAIEGKEGATFPKALGTSATRGFREGRRRSLCPMPAGRCGLLVMTPARPDSRSQSSTRRRVRLNGLSRARPRCHRCGYRILCDALSTLPPPAFDKEHSDFARKKIPAKGPVAGFFRRAAHRAGEGVSRALDAFCYAGRCARSRRATA